MPRVPDLIYPHKKILDALISTIENDSDFSDLTTGLLACSVSQDLAITKGKPLNFETAVFSDLNFHIAIYHVNESDMMDDNNLRTDTLKYYIDVAYKDQYLDVAINKVSELCQDIIFTLEENKNLNYSGMLMPKKKIDPIGTLPEERLWLFCSTISLTVKTNTIYR
jgi:hypothetical protein